MSFSINPLIASVVEPPIGEAQAWIAGRDFPADRPLIDLSQAVPSYPPAAALTDHLAELLPQPECAFYTEIPGLPALRGALAQHMSDAYDADLGPDSCFITAGCNQAFCLALMALARSGDQVLLPVPYYFNHQMWLEMLGVEAVHLPFRSDRAGVPDPADAERLIGERTRAIILVSPNNPTGAVYPPEVMAAFHRLARDRSLALVVDETYKDFLSGAAAPHDLFRTPDWSETFVQLYSFSKVFSLTGYRVGSIIAGRRLLEAVGKIMDCVAICAPRVGQEAALFGLQHLGGWVSGKRELIERRKAALGRLFAKGAQGYELLSAGAYFAYVRHPFGPEPAERVAKRLADRANVLALPGSMFGPEQEACLRFAYANVSEEAIDQLGARLATS